jgi:transposase-like protein
MKQKCLCDIPGCHSERDCRKAGAQFRQGPGSNWSAARQQWLCQDCARAFDYYTE